MECPGIEWLSEDVKQDLAMHRQAQHPNQGE